MANDRSQLNFNIRSATRDDIDFCISLEQELHPGLPDAAEQEFLLQGASKEQCLDGSYIFLTEKKNELIDFLVAIPRGHFLIKKLHTFALQLQRDKKVPTERSIES